jgi:signal transduction histidine kinase
MKESQKKDDLQSNARGFSLSTYLFALVGLFILALAGVQLGFIAHIEDKVNEEVSAKSTAVSNRAIEIITTSLPSDPKQSRFPELLAKLKEKEEVSKEFISVEKKLVELKEELDEHTKFKIISSENNSFVFDFPSDIEPSIELISFTDQESAVAEHFRWLTYATLALMLTGLVFAFWLSRHISRPLKLLSSGFENLRRGQLGTRVKRTGVSEMKRTIHQFNKTSERLKELQAVANRYEQQKQLAELGEVSRGLAHSLRNPLNTIGLAVEQIAETDLDAQQRSQIVEQARAKIQVLDKMIKSLLTLSTSGVDREQKVNVNQAIEDAVLQVSMCGANNITIAAEQQVFLRGSIVEITALIHTLVTNAMESNLVKDSSQPGSIEVRLSTSLAETMVSVIDEGTGLSSDIQERLFEPHITNKAEGAGMGLYIAKRILTLHYSGDLFLKNNIAQGCTATMVFKNSKVSL